MRSCSNCKRKIADDESCWRDMTKRYYCNDCYQPQAATVRKATDK